MADKHRLTVAQRLVLREIEAGWARCERPMYDARTTEILHEQGYVDWHQEMHEVTRPGPLLGCQYRVEALTLTEKGRLALETEKMRRREP